ncbi:MAG: RDD family protein [Chloroflexota bacterium]
MDHHLLTTPENVPIDFELAGVGSRFAAALIDNLILFAVEVGLLIVASIFAALVPPLAATSASIWVIALVTLLLFATLIGYPLLFELIWNGQTPGKRLIGIRMVRDDGGPITGTAAVIRNVVRIIDFLPAYYIIGIIVMLIDRKSRRLGDLAAGTLCVKERRDITVDKLTAPRHQPLPDQHIVDGDLRSLDRLSYEDRHLVQEYLFRRNQMTSAAAEELAARIASRLAAKLGVELAESADRFLERLGATLEQGGRR